MKQTGYKMKEYGIPTKRYCQTLDLKDDPELISEYRKRYGERSMAGDSARYTECRYLEMEIYILDNRLFMIVETPFDFDWDEAFARLATLPRQEEWETYMSIFQVARPGATSAEKWRMMERIFHLY